MPHTHMSIAVLLATTCIGLPAQAEQAIFRGRLVTYSIVNNRKLFEGDIILDHVTPIPTAQGAVTDALRTQSVGTAYPQYLWPANGNGIAEIPYIVTNGALQLNAALTAFNNTFAGVIQFVPRDTQPDYVNFDFDGSDYSGTCDSEVGHVGGQQTTGGSYQCNLGTLLHEMGHIVGLYHEQSRPDRDAYVTLNYANVIKGSEANFNQLSDNFQDLGPFDYASVMQYIPFAFSRNGGPVVDSIPPGMKLSNLTGYTAADIDGVKRMYGATPTKVTIVTNPPGLSVIVDGTTVTTPHTYNWKLKSTHTLAVASTAQILDNAAFIYGRWNDSTAASHSVTVAPGNNTPAAPKSSPAITVYTANFIQLSAYTAAAMPSGSGTISVSPAPQAYAGAPGQYLVARQPLTLSAAPSGAYQFVTWGGVPAPYSANPKPDYAPDGGAPYAVTGYFSTMPITTVTTHPGGFYFAVDNTYYKAPQSFTSDLFSGWTPGSTHTVSGFSPNQPYSVNTRYIFNSWSDGGALTHSITLPSGASTISGAFTAQYVPIAYAIPYCGARITLKPVSPDGFYTAGTPVTINAKPAGGLKLTGWTGDLTGTRASQVLTVNDEELAVANFNVSVTPFTLAALSPAILPTGGSGTVKIKGSGFVSTAAVFVNNTYHASTFVNSKEIDVALTAADLGPAGAFPIGVSNYGADGTCGNYAALSFFVSH